MIIKLLTEHQFEFLSLNGGCTGSSESTLVKIPHCWKSYVAAQISADSHQLVSVQFNTTNSLYHFTDWKSESSYGVNKS